MAKQKPGLIYWANLLKTILFSGGKLSATWATISIRYCGISMIQTWLTSVFVIGEIGGRIN